MTSVVSCPVNIQANPTLGALSHMAIQVPMPIPVVNFSIEMLTFQFWIYGYVTNKNQFAKKVRHKHQWIVQDGHDCGMLIPDITIPIVGNILYLVQWPFSKRAITFSASTVKMENKSTACAAVWPPFPMMTCGAPISAPTSLSYLANLNNVYVGVSWTDIFAGVLAIVISIAIDLIFNKIGNKLAGPANQAATRTARELLTRAVLPALAGKLGALDFAKSVVSGLAGIVTSGLTGDPTFKVGYGLPPIIGIEYSATSTDEGIQHNVQGEALGVQGDTTGNRSWWGESTPASATPPSAGGS